MVQQSEQRSRITPSRSAGALVVAAAAVMFAGASIPFLTNLGGEAWQGTPDEVLAAVSRDPSAWRLANGLIALAAAATAVGLAWITGVFDSGRATARAGLIAFVIGSSSELVSRVLNMTLTKWVAEGSGGRAIADSYEGFYLFGEGLIDAFILLGFVALALFGIAVRQEGITWLGTMLVIFGLGGLVLELIGAAIPALVYIGTAILGISLGFRPSRHTAVRNASLPTQ